MVAVIQATIKRHADDAIIQPKTTIRQLLDTRNVHADKAAVAAGLAMLDAGGDFADGVIAHDGIWQGAEVFVSFDRKAVSLLKARGVVAQLP